MNDKFGEHLLKLARFYISEKVGKRMKMPDDSGFDKLLSTKRGVFVTLSKHGRLRGCIGIPEPLMSISGAIKEAAVSAAFNDPRFIPLEYKEFDDTTIEVTLLTKPIEITRPFREKIVIGRDGIIVRCGTKSGLFLPQVPTEQGWNVDEYLIQICFKAGLFSDCLKNPESKLYTFQGTVYKEQYNGHKN